jgi:SOS response regulatory protein OraA/RecX
MMKYEKEIDKLLEELFRADWMSDEDYSNFVKEVLSQTGISKQLLSEQMELGVMNGFDIETQIEAVKKAVKGEETGG